MKGTFVTAETAGMESTAKMRIGGFYHQEHQSQRGQGPSSVPTGYKFVSVKLWRNRIEFAHEPDDPVFFRVHFRFNQHHFDAAEKEQRAKKP